MTPKEFAGVCVRYPLKERAMKCPLVRATFQFVSEAFWDWCQDCLPPLLALGILGLAYYLCVYRYL